MWTWYPAYRMIETTIKSSPCGLPYQLWDYVDSHPSISMWDASSLWSLYNASRSICNYEPWKQWYVGLLDLDILGGLVRNDIRQAGGHYRSIRWVEVRRRGIVPRSYPRPFLRPPQQDESVTSPVAAMFPHSSQSLAKPTKPTNGSISYAWEFHTFSSSEFELGSVSTMGWSAGWVCV